jgi:hypothetical protein
MLETPASKPPGHCGGLCNYDRKRWIRVAQANQDNARQQRASMKKAIECRVKGFTN